MLIRLLFAFFLIATPLFPKTTTDSLEMLLRNSSGTSKVDVLNELADEFNRDNQTKKSMNFSEEALILAESLGYSEGEADAYYAIGESYKIDDNYNKSLEHFRLAYELYKKENKSAELAYTMRKIGDIYYFTGNYDNALRNYIDALRLFERLSVKDTNKRISSNVNYLYTCIGNTYRILEKYDAALEYYEKSLKIYENMGFKIGIAGTLNNLGIVYQNLKEYDSALRSYSKAQKLSAELGAKELQAIVLINLGATYLDLKQFDKATEYFLQAKSLAEQLGRKSSILTALMNIGSVNFEQGNFPLAIDNFKQALAIAREISDNLNISKIYSHLSENYEKLHNDSAALAFFKLYSISKDSLFNMEKAKQINELQIAFGSELKEREIKYLRSERERQAFQKKSIIIGAAAALVFMLIIAIVLYKLYRMKNKANILLSEKNKEIEDHKIELEHLNNELQTRNQELYFVNRNLSESEANLKEAVATKDKFFSIIAHDLKNPLGSFRNLTDMLMDYYDSMSKEEMKKFIITLQKSASHTSDLLENLLQWSRSQTGSMKFKPEFIDLHSIAEKNISMLRVQSDKKKIALLSNIKVNTRAYADEQMVGTILLNLISNAIKFTPPDGKINISVNESNDFIVVNVADSGIGISEHDIAKLFRIDIHHTTPGTDNEKGTGLGLILCKEFIEKNAGNIWVESRPGKGSEFKFTLPKSVKS